jgi:hypothetical protein
VTGFLKDKKDNKVKKGKGQLVLLNSVWHGLSKLTQVIGTGTKGYGYGYKV